MSHKQSSAEEMEDQKTVLYDVFAQWWEELQVPEKTLTIEELKGWVAERQKRCIEMQPALVEQLKKLESCLMIDANFPALRDTKETVEILNNIMEDLLFFVENALDYRLLD